MKATLLRGELLDAVKTAQRVLNGKITLENLKSVKIQVTKDNIVITGTDLDTALFITIKDRGDRIKGEVLVPPKQLIDFLKKVSTDTVTLTTTVTKSKTPYRRRNPDTGEWEDATRIDKIPGLEVKAGATKMSFDTLDPSDYPDIRSFLKRKTWLCNVKLADALQTITYAASRDDARFVLNGISFKTANNSLHLAAADGYRLATRTLHVNLAKNKSSAFVAPIKAALILEKEMAGTVSIFETDKYVEFAQNNLSLVACKVIGTYPVYESLIPKGGGKCTFNRHQMIEAVKLTMPVTKMKNNAIVRLKARNGIVNVHTSGDTKISSEVVCKGKVQIAFDPKFFLDMLNNTPGDEITILTTTPRSPATVKNRTVHVLMPKFVQW